VCFVSGLVFLVVNKLRRYINVDSFDKSNAEMVLFDVANTLMTNRAIIADYGQLFTRTRNQNEMTLQRIGKFLTRNGIIIEAHSTSESVRGRLYKDQRPDFVMLDDFETNKTKDSAAYIEQVQKHIDELATGVSADAVIL
jgi:multimeric flavodoxin WrbA